MSSNIPTPMNPVDNPVDLPEIIGGKYRPRSVLGLGATGTVYCVEHTFTGDLLALKVLQPHLSASPEAIARFKGEARTAAKLRSRHVVRIFDADVARELGNAPYLVMELLEGSNLEHLASEGRIAPEVVVDWLRQAAVPLERAHKLGIVHRDLKPENLFLTTLDDGSPLLKILDFGIARIAESPGMTKSGQLFGTPLYMAPEQARGDPSQIGPATDVFALGLIAYKLLMSSEYRTEAGLGPMLHEILNEPLRPPSQKGCALGDGFDQWFLRSCDPDPSLRFTSVREQVEALAVALGFPEASNAGGPSSSSRSIEPARSSWVGVPGMGDPASGPGRGPASSRATTIHRARTAPELETIPTLSGADVVADVVADVEREPSTPNGWRRGFFAVCAIALVAVGAAWFRRSPTVLAATPRVAGCPTDTVALATPANDNAPACPIGAGSASATPAAPETTKATTTAMRPITAEASRALLVRPIAAPPAHKRASDDDPLSDQK